jgi:hypothetical protein
MFRGPIGVPEKQRSLRAREGRREIDKLGCIAKQREFDVFERGVSLAVQAKHYSSSIVG